MLHLFLCLILKFNINSNNIIKNIYIQEQININNIKHKNNIRYNNNIFYNNNISYNNNNNNNTAIIFCTGGGNIVPLNIYSDFIKIFSDFNFTVYKYDYNFDKQFNDIKKKHNNIFLLGHSSGCTNILNSYNDNLKKIILLDPVKNPFIYKNYNLNYLDKILIINAYKSYQWSIFPPFIPFIPFLKIKKKDILIDNNKINIKNFLYFGHCDIINNPFRDIMHYSNIASGNKNRTIENIYNYYICIILLINEFIYEN